MSDIYPTGADGPVHPDRARPGRDGPRDLPPRRERPAPRRPGTRSSVICENCGKVGTTIVTDWDGERVVLRVPGASSSTWARGCGHSRLGRRRSAAAAKLPWNLEWAAQWSLFGVTIEPCGKDLSTAGGSRDRSDAIAREVFEREPPLNVPYEFLNIGGKKMSTSKGRGAAAHEIVEVIPPEQLRFLFLRPQAEPARSTSTRTGPTPIPRLFDEFDRFAAATAGREVKGELAAGLRGDVPLLARSTRRRRRRRGGRVPAGVRAPRAARSRSRASTSRSGCRGGEGQRRSTSASSRSSTSALAAARAWLEAYAPERARWSRCATRCPPRPRRSTTSSAATSPRWRDAPRRAAGRDGEAWQDADLRRSRRGRAAARAAPSRRSTSRSSAGRTARARAGCSPASTRRSSSSACARPAAAARGGAA